LIAPRGYLLDTDVIWETRRKRPDSGVIETTFADRVLPIDAPVARRWGEASAGRSIPVIDTLIAATALEHGLTLVTRNTGDFLASGPALLNPWQERTT
jgi:predicted nucleic acid-binding protein